MIPRVNPMLPLWPVLWVFALHLLGDFHLQTNDIAMRKSTSWSALLEHVAIVTATLFIGMGVWQAFGMLPHGSSRWGLPYWVLINGALHFVTDAVTSRITSRYWFIPFRRREAGRNELDADGLVASSSEWP